MKILVFLLLLIMTNSYGQDIHTIRFVHRGEELKPIGTLLICVEKLVQPTDRPFDEIFGRSVKTNMETFKTIEKFIKVNKYTTFNPKALKGDNEFYEIIDSDGLKLYFGEHNIHQFFNGLRLSLKSKGMDEAVIEELKRY